MADFTALKTAIQNAIKQNGNEEITGNLLQEVLLAIVTTLGDGSINDLITALGSEATTRQQADGTLQQNINTEANARSQADTALDGRIDGVVSSIEAINDAIENGYVYAGIATPSSTPAAGKVFYLALTAGTYTNFNGLEVSQGINILKNNGSTWSLDSFVGIDDAPAPSSQKLVKSGGVFDEVMKNGSAFDLSAYNGGATYADLNAALTALNALPAAYKRGGMSMKFVLSSDNKYVQARLMANSFTTDVTKWQVVEEVPTKESKNLVKSGGVYKAIKESTLALQNIFLQNPESFYITDFYGNVVAVINKNGINTLGYSQPSADSIETGKEGFKICDKNGNIAFKLSSNFSFGDNLVKFIISEYNKPKVSWIDDDFLIYSNGQLAPEYEALHTWCLNNNIRLDFAFINGLYEGTPQYQDRINLAKEWLRESFNFLLHPFHDGWYNAADNTYDLSKVRSSIIDAIQCFKENYFPTGDNILVYPGSSSNFPAIVELIKNYVDCAIIATENETNHLFKNNRYGFKRYSLGFSSTKTKTKIKQDLAYFISRGDWVILETHLYDVRNDLTTLDETTNSLANILDVVNYVNTLCPLEPTYRVWKERSFMFDIINK